MAEIATIILVAIVIAIIAFILFFYIKLLLIMRGFDTYSPCYPIVGQVLNAIVPPEEMLPLLKSHCMDSVKQGLFVAAIGMRPVFFIFEPQISERLLSSNVNINKSQEYMSLDNWLGRGLLMNIGSKWRVRRKILTPAFHFQTLRGFMDVFLKVK